MIRECESRVYNSRCWLNGVTEWQPGFLVSVIVDCDASLYKQNVSSITHLIVQVLRLHNAGPTIPSQWNVVGLGRK